MLISRREFLKGVAVGAGGACLGVVPWRSFAAEADSRKWNVIIILTDDQGYEDLSCYSSPSVKTPNIDALATGGIRFTDYYSGGPVCSPARAALLTGCYPQRLGIYDVFFPGTAGMNPDEFTIAKLAKKAGYATGAIGKWHLGNQPKYLPTSNGFDSFFGLPFSNDMCGNKDKMKGLPKESEAKLDEIWKRTKESRTWYDVPLYRDDKVIEQTVDQTTLTERYTEEAVSFIDRNKERPFLLYLAHSMPHVPLFVPDDRYDPDPKNAFRLAVEHIDNSTGRIVDALKKSGLDKNTIVMFTSDNGPWLQKGHHGGSAKPLTGGKRSLREGAMRVPCILWAPGLIPGGQVCREIATGMDILPTLSELTGAELPKDRVIDGHSILPLIKGAPGTKSPTEAVYYYSGSEIKGIRVGPWKLLPRGDDLEKAELVNLTAIDGEKDKIEPAKHMEMVKSMVARMKEFDRDLKAHSRVPARQGKKKGADASAKAEKEDGE